MKERPILYTGSNVRAILEDRKTQMRRIIKPQPPDGAHPFFILCSNYEKDEGKWRFAANKDHLSETVLGPIACPYGKPGDRLWVRETHRYWWPDWEDPGSNPCRCRYKADDATLDLPVSWNEEPNFDTPGDQGLDIEPSKWRPSIFMPCWASRIKLEITGVRVERLQQISDADALAEGCSAADMRSGDSLASVYARLWESIHGPGSWDANPRVWVVEFRRLITPTPLQP